MKLDNLNKFAQVISIIAVLLFGTIVVLLNNGPIWYCHRWGGKLYGDGNCYFTNKMGMCLDSQGYIREGLGQIKLNISGEPQ